MYLNSSIENYAHNLFIQSKDCSLTYAETAVLVSKLSFWLKKNGVSEGDNVVILADNSPEYIITLHALFRIKAVAILLNTKLAISEIEKQVKYCQAKFTLLGDSYKKYDKLKSIFLPKINEIKEFSSHYESSEQEARKDPSLIIFTSGSSDKPKACVLSEANLTISGEALSDYYKLTKDDCYFLSLPLFTVGALGAMYRAISVGASVFVAKNLSTQSLVENIKNYNISCISLVPVQLKGILDALKTKDSSSLRKLNLILIGGAKVDLDLIHVIKEFDLPVYIPYGMTELSSSATCGKLQINDEVLSSGNYSYGLPAPHVEIKIIDTVTKEELPKNKVGLVSIKSDALFLGYLQEDQSLQKFKSFEPGDLGKINEYGNLYLKGRIDRMINTGGLKVFPEEIETQLSKETGTSNVAVVSYEDAKWGMRPAAYLETDEERIDLANLTLNLKQNLGGFKVPSRFIAKDKLPILGSGKVDYKALSGQTFKTSMFYRTLGNPENPCLILLHGTFGHGSDWLEVAKMLLDDFFVVLPDLPAFGNSLREEYKDELSFALLIDELNALIEDLSPKKLYLGGYSFGARTALLFALNTKHKIDGLFVESLNPGILDEDERKVRCEKEEKLATRIESSAWEEFLNFWYSIPLFGLENKPELKSTVIEKRMSTDPTWAAHTLRKLSPGVMPYMGNDLGKISCPVTLLAGERDEKFVNFAKELSPKFNSLEDCEFLDAAHNVHLECPSEVAQLLKKLIRA